MVRRRVGFEGERRCSGGTPGDSVPLVRDHDKWVGEQMPGLDRRRPRPQMRDRDVDPPALQLLGLIGAMQRPEVQRRRRRGRRERSGEWADQRNLGVLAHPGGEGDGAGHCVEPCAEVEDRFDLLDRRRYPRRDLRASGSLGCPGVAGPGRGNLAG